MNIVDEIVYGLLVFSFILYCFLCFYCFYVFSSFIAMFYCYCIDVSIDVRLLHLNKEYLLTYLLTEIGCIWQHDYSPSVRLFRSCITSRAPDRGRSRWRHVNWTDTHVAVAPNTSHWVDLCSSALWICDVFSYGLTRKLLGLLQCRHAYKSSYCQQ